jgi:iron complex outermembrane recepter protein
MSKAFRGVVAGSVGLAIALAQAQSGFAQTPPTTAASSSEVDSSGSLEEIVVTAEKRSEDVQKIPVVVATASAEQLERAGALQLRDLERAIPDVIIAPQGAALTMMIRGVYSTDTSPGSENANAINLDGAYLPKTQGLGGLLFDVQRIEVAEGPQGTLYGRNANGGAINIITNKAAIGEDSASGLFEYGSYQLIHSEGAINMALSDDFSVRAAFHSLSHEGYMTGGQDDADEKGGRVGFTWKPNERESLWGTFDIATIGGNNAGTNVVYASPGSNVFVPANPRDNSYFATIIDPLTGAVQSTRQNEVTFINSHNNGMTLQNDYDFGPAVWTTQFNWRNFNSQSSNINNWAEQYCPVAGAAPAGTVNTTCPAATGPYGIAGRNTNPQHFDSQSLETRLTSTATTPLQWVVGLYAFHDRDGGTMIGYANLVTQTPSIQIANGGNGGAGIGEHAESYAGFGQVTWTPVDRLHFVAGGRYTQDIKDVQGIFTQFGLGPIALTPPKENSWSKGTYLGGVNFDLTSKSIVYAKVSTGYEAGGFSYGPGVNPAEGPVYAPETITAYEIGSKNTFLDGTLRVNLAGWVYSYKDYQTNLALFRNGIPGPPVLTATSAGEATYRGASLDTQWAFTKYDLVSLNATFLTARYGTFIAPAPAGYTTNPTVPNAPQILSGQAVPTVPSADGSLAYDHTFALPKGSVDWQASVNYKGNTLLAEAFEGAYGLISMEQKAFALFNTSLRYNSENGKWSATVYGNNLANSIKYRSGAITSPSYNSAAYYEDAQLYDPRIFGVIFQAHIM